MHLVLLLELELVLAYLVLDLLSLVLGVVNLVEMELDVDSGFELARSWC